MTAYLAPQPVPQFFGNDGKPLAGGSLYTYAAGTSTPQVTYTDSAGGTPNANPIILDAFGRCAYYLDPALSYKLVLKDASGNTVWTADNLAGAAPASLIATLASSAGAGMTGYKGPGATSILRDVNDSLRDIYSVFDEFTSAQRADVRARTKLQTVGAALTAALVVAQAAGAAAWLPAGSYNINDGASATNWAGANVYGAGINNTILAKTTAGDAITFTGCSRGAFSSIAMDGTGMASGNGLVITGATGLMYVTDCQFANFPARGLYANFSAGSHGSGCKYLRNVFLSNGVTSGTPQAEYRYSDDSEWAGNQYGTNLITGPFPTIGAYLYSCQAGDYGPANYHWDNLVGGVYELCSYTRFVDNRWETNQNEGLKVIGTSRCSFVGNHIHTNSQASSGTYDGMAMTNCGRWTFTGNKFYTFSVALARYCLSMDVACSSIVLGDNEFFDYATKPVLWDRTSTDIRFKNNLPGGFGLDQAQSSIARGKVVSVAAGVTTFAGTNGSSFTEADVDQVCVRAAMAVTTRVNLSVAPGVGKSVVITLRKLGADTAHVVTISDNATTGTITSEISYADSNTYAWKIVSGAGAATTAVTIATAFDA